MDHWIEGLIANWGPVAVFLGCFFEGETAAILGGMVAHRGLASWPQIAVLAFLGAFLADVMWFALSRRLPDRGLLLRLRLRAEAHGLPKMLERHRRLMTLAFRFLPGTRVAGPILLGRTNMGFAEFVGLNAAASALWAVVFTGIGWHFGRAAQGLFGRLHGHHWLWLMALILVIAAAYHLIMRRRMQR